ncbi:MAG TPA: hypothetical protein VGH16_03305 [Candidatus Binatia bacterium]
MKYSMIGLAMLTVIAAAGCGKDDKSSAERDAEVKKVLQQGADMEKKMYEGVQKGVENIEKKVQDAKK